MVCIVPPDESVTKQILTQAMVSEPGSRCLTAKNGTVLCGYVVYRPEGDAVRLLALRADDRLLEDGLVRAALNAAREQGAVTAICTQTALFDVLCSLGFSKAESAAHEAMSAEINTVLQGHCGR